jgi:phage tail-like protein
MKTRSTVLAACGLTAIVVTTFLGVRAHAAGATRADSMLSFHVKVNTDVDLGMATDAQFIGSENEIVEARQGADATRSMKIPGRLKYPDVVLKRGYTSDLSWYRWRKQVEDGQVTAARKDTTLLVQDQTGVTVTTVKLLRAWPSGYKVSAGAGTEELTISCEGWSRQ